MKKIYFIILHYQELKATEECVDSILNNYSNSEIYTIHIIIIDNASPNRSGYLLRDKYSNISTINVVINNENLGFAKGNNIGYKMAVSKGADFIIQINNDTVFDDITFVDNVLKIYEKEKYGVLGPDIVLYDTEIHQNPMKGFEFTKKNVLKKILRNRLGFLLSLIGLDVIIKRNNDAPVSVKEWSKTCSPLKQDQVLQGSCLIFSTIYMKQFPDGMCDKTFMYYEEYILDYLCKKNKCKIIYSEKLHILHKHKISTSNVIPQRKKQRQFKYKNSIASLKVLYDLL